MTARNWCCRRVDECGPLAGEQVGRDPVKPLGYLLRGRSWRRLCGDGGEGTSPGHTCVLPCHCEGRLHEQGVARIGLEVGAVRRLPTRDEGSGEAGHECLFRGGDSREQRHRSDTARREVRDQEDPSSIREDAGQVVTHLRHREMGATTARDGAARGDGSEGKMGRKSLLPGALLQPKQLRTRLTKA